MPHTTGYRGRTRHLFAKSFRGHGVIGLAKSMINYRVGDIVDVVADGAIQKGMPHKFYHGKTGRVFNVTKHGLGVIVNKKVGNRIIPKRINVRTGHVRKSASREAFKDRIRENDKLKEAANKKGGHISTKRIPAQPRQSHVVKAEIETLNPLRFRYVF
jgi:large subunit ribosomal protein L21e